MTSIERIAFVIYPDFSLLGYSLAMEMLRFANEVAGQTIYQSLIVAERTAAVACSNGTQLLPDVSFAEMGEIDKILICSSNRYPNKPAPVKIHHWLNQHFRNGVSIGALGSGVWMLAESGLLNFRRCAVHWSEADAFRESYPRVEVSTEQYVVDDRIFTSAGGDSVTDMMLLMIAAQHGAQFAERVRGTILLKPAQIGNAQQNLLTRSLNGKSAKLTQTLLRVLEDNLENPLTLPSLSRLLNVNERTLNRHTRRSFGCSPKALYLQVRLDRARSLLAYSSLGITDVAISCGFRSLAHFSSSFKQKEGIAPSQWRATRTSGNLGAGGN